MLHGIREHVVSSAPRIAAGLRFADDTEERSYVAGSEARELPVFRAAILLAAVTYAVFGLTDVVGDTGGVASTRFRYMVACPSMVAFYAMTHAGFAKGRLRPLVFGFSIVASLHVAVIVYLLDAGGGFRIGQGNATTNCMLATTFLAILPLATMDAVVVSLLIQVMHVVLVVAFGGFDFAHVSISLGFVGSSAVVACGATYWRERLMRDAFRREREVEREREGMQAQILSLMSMETLSRVSDPTRSVADVFGEVTVLFCDLVGFTQMSERLAPKHLVELLTAIFSRLDEIAAEHGVEKVKTIGDAYMAVTGGADGKSGTARDRPVEDMADFALAVRAESARFTDDLGHPIGFRMGVHTGSLIGGVIGKKGRVYDYWGRTVNMAARLEASAAEGRIQVSEATYYRLRHSFDMVDKGEVGLRGIGQVRAFELAGRK